MKIAILYVCIGKYSIFWKDFYLSCEKHFLPGVEKLYFVFTDSNVLDYENENKNICLVYQDNLGFPDNTLMRYEMFLRKKNEILKTDYAFFFNANIIFLKDVSGEDFLPGEHQSLVAVIHPGFYDKKNNEFTYERNKKSLAYIPYGSGNKYFQGAINGGKSNDFMAAAEKMNSNILEDKKNNIVSVWWDESHWNRYLDERLDITKILTPSYLYPEGYNIPFTPKVFIRNKNQFGNINVIRNLKFKLNISLILNLCKRIKNKIIYILFRFYDSIFYSKSKLFKLKKVANDSNKRISVVITYYNRHETIHKALFNIVNDDRVNEILIVDDGSDKKSFLYLTNFIRSVNNIYGNKIKIMRNNINLGMYKNKIYSLGQSSNDWVILLDSDNTITKKYLDTIYSFARWDMKTMYCPSFAWPLINNEKLSNLEYDFDSIKNLLIHESKNIDSFLNLGNFFVNKNYFKEVMSNYFDCTPFAADSIFINYAWLCHNGRLCIPKNCKYVHRVNSDSTWKTENLKSVVKFENIKNAILMSEKDVRRVV